VGMAEGKAVNPKNSLRSAPPKDELWESEGWKEQGEMREAGCKSREQGLCGEISSSEATRSLKKNHMGEQLKKNRNVSSTLQRLNVKTLKLPQLECCKKHGRTIRRQKVPRRPEKKGVLMVDTLHSILSLKTRKQRERGGRKRNKRLEELERGMFW